MQFHIFLPCFTNLESASGQIKFDNRKFHSISSFPLNSCGLRRKVCILWAGKKLSIALAQKLSQKMQTVKV